MESNINLILPFPVSVNALYGVFRGRKLLSKKGRLYKERVSTILGADREPFSGDIICHYNFYRGDKRKYDISNYVKSVEDCITEANFWHDDSQLVEIVLTKMAVDRDNPRVEVEIIGVDYE